jgi:hypothetical protein
MPVTNRPADSGVEASVFADAERDWLVSHVRGQRSRCGPMGSAALGPESLLGVVSVFRAARDKASVGPLTHDPMVYRECRIRSRALRRAGPTDWPS